MTSNPNRLFEGMRNVFCCCCFSTWSQIIFRSWIDCVDPFAVLHLPPLYHLRPSLNILSFSGGLGSFPVNSQCFPIWLAPDPLLESARGNLPLATCPGPGSEHRSQPWTWVLSAYRMHLTWHIYPLRQWLSNLFWLWPAVRRKIDIITQYTHNSSYVNV